MIIYNNQEFKTFKELREKCHLVSERYIRALCHCRKSTTEKICKENNIEKHIVIAQGKECEVFSDVVIDLIYKIKPQGFSSIPENYITAQELAKYLKDFLGYQDSRYQFEVYGPIPCVIYELRGKYRMSFVIKAVNKSAINSVFKRLITDFDHTKYPMSFDNDPQDG